MTRPGRTILSFLVFYAVAFSALALAGYDDSLPALRLTVGALAGYVVEHLASRAPGQPGRTVATFSFYAALGAIAIFSIFIATSAASVTSNPWWLAGLGFVSGVFAAAFLRIRSENPPSRPAG